MGKVVILGGNARSGKSTLSFQLVKKGFSRISFDNLNELINDILNIKELNKEQSFKLFERIVNKSIEETKIYNTNIVIDMYDYLPEDINKLKNKDKIEIYFLAYPNCSKEQIKYNIIHYSKPTDWIAQVNEKYLNECIEKFDKRNKLLIEETKKYNYRLIDTTFGEERNTILNNLFTKIID